MKNDVYYDINSKGLAKNEQCNCCPRQCGVNRNIAIGYCKSKGLRIARFGLHMWEEPCISGTQGSGTIFFSGCALRCIYCQNYEVSQLSKGYDISVMELVEIFKKLEALGANNINLVTPSHYVDYIIMALQIYKPSVPVCYNTSGYESLQTLDRLAGFVDIFLVDFKYIQPHLSVEFSASTDYPQVAKQAILKIKKLQPNNIFDSRGIMQKGVVIRHLVLPSCIQNSKDILLWIAQNVGTDSIVSIMNQYTPYGKAIGHKLIGRKLKPLEYKIIVNYAQKLGFDNAYIQYSDSANECYIPQFFGDNAF